jgi:hypothetical protein
MKQFLRPLAWVLVGLNIILMGVGLALQIISGYPMFGVPMVVHFSESIALAGFAAVGALIVSRHPKHMVGWSWLLLAISFGGDHFAWGYTAYGTTATPAALPGVSVSVFWLEALGRRSIGFLAFTLLLLLFPTGRPLSSRWGLVGWVAVGRAILAVLFSSIAFAKAPPTVKNYIAASSSLSISSSAQGRLDFVLTLVGLVCILSAVLSLYVRFIRSKGVERQQIKWFVFATLFVPPAFLLIALAGQFQDVGMTWMLILGPILGVIGSFGIAAASAIAILRFRLWDIDIIIRRTMVYGLLTFILGLIYLSTVILFQRILQAVTGQGSNLAIIGSTLIIAALSAPLRRRVQDFIDRRFYRQKFNAESVIADFSAGMRLENDIEQLSDRLVGVIEDTLQPTRTSLWLKRREIDRPISGQGTKPTTL